MKKIKNNVIIDNSNMYKELTLSDNHSNNKSIEKETVTDLTGDMSLLDKVDEIPVLFDNNYFTSSDYYDFQCTPSNFLNYN